VTALAQLLTYVFPREVSLSLWVNGWQVEQRAWLDRAGRVQFVVVGRRGPRRSA